jgi:hypothetical protein
MNTNNVVLWIVVAAVVVIALALLFSGAPDPGPG